MCDAQCMRRIEHTLYGTPAADCADDTESPTRGDRSAAQCAHGGTLLMRVSVRVMVMVDEPETPSSHPWRQCVRTHNHIFERLVGRLTRYPGD